MNTPKGRKYPRVAGHAVSYASGVQWAKENFPKHHASVQHYGQGGQSHPWTVILTGRIS